MSSRSADTARRDVRRLAFARLISLAGTDASAIAVSFTLYAQTGSTRWLSASLLIMFGLGSVVAPLAGWLADRADRLTLMVVADLAAAGVFVALAFVHSPAALLGLSVLATIAGTVHGPAAGAAIPAVAGEQHLSWANGLLATGGTIGQMAGRLGGGLLVAVLGAGGVFALDAVTFLASAALVWSVREALRAAPTADRRIRSRAVGREGWRALAGNRTLRLVIGSSCIATLMTSFTMTAEAPLAAAFDAGPVGLGALAAAWSLGMVFGSMAGGRVLHAGNEVNGLLSGRIVMGAGIASVAVAPVFWPTLVSYVVGGAAGGFLLVAATSLIQRSAGDDIRGRALATADGIKSAAFGAGVLLAGSVVGAVGPQATYAFVGIGVVVSAVPVARLVRLEAQERTAPAAAPALA